MAGGGDEPLLLPCSINAQTDKHEASLRYFHGSMSGPLHLTSLD